MATEKRLIDANELAKNWFYTNDTGTKVVELLEIEQAPTVDAVEVVRCKDCRFWEECDSSLIGKVMCCTGQGNIKIQKSEEDYCSYGERRTNEN